MPLLGTHHLLHVVSPCIECYCPLCSCLLLSLGDKHNTLVYLPESLAVLPPLCWHVSILYAMMLVVATVIALQFHSCNCCAKFGRRCGKRNIRGSIVDGLSAFLVLCYFQCSLITFYIQPTNNQDSLLHVGYPGV